MCAHSKATLKVICTASCDLLDCGNDVFAQQGSNHQAVFSITLSQVQGAPKSSFFFPDNHNGCIGAAKDKPLKLENSACKSNAGEAGCDRLLRPLPCSAAC